MIRRCDAPALPTISLEFPDASVQDPNAAESPQELLWRAQGATVRLLRVSLAGDARPTSGYLSCTSRTTGR